MRGRRRGRKERRQERREGGLEARKKEQRGEKEKEEEIEQEGERERGISCYHIWHAIASLVPVPPLFLFSIRMEENRDSNTYHVRGTWRGVTLIM